MGALADRARFLFRSEAGTIDAATWRRHVAWLAALISVLTAFWLMLRPYAHHDLATTPFIAPMTIAAFAYLIVYAFAVLVISISYTMLSMKRLRDRGDPTGLAALLPFLAFCAGCLHFLQAKTPDVISAWFAYGLDGVLVAVVVWTVFQLGFAPGRSA